MKFFSCGADRRRRREKFYKMCFCLLIFVNFNNFDPSYEGLFYCIFNIQFLPLTTKGGGSDTPLAHVCLTNSQNLYPIRFLITH